MVIGDLLQFVKVADRDVPFDKYFALIDCEISAMHLKKREQETGPQNGPTFHHAKRATHRKNARPVGHTCVRVQQSRYQPPGIVICKSTWHWHAYSKPANMLGHCRELALDRLDELDAESGFDLSISGSFCSQAC